MNITRIAIIQTTGSFSRDFAATLKLYVFAICFLSPFASLIYVAFGLEKLFNATPVLVVLFVVWYHLYCSSISKSDRGSTLKLPYVEILFLYGFVYVVMTAIENPGILGLNTLTMVSVASSQVHLVVVVLLSLVIAGMILSLYVGGDKRFPVTCIGFVTCLALALTGTYAYFKYEVYPGTSPYSETNLVPQNVQLVNGYKTIDSNWIILENGAVPNTSIVTDDYENNVMIVFDIAMLTADDGGYRGQVSTSEAVWRYIVGRQETSKVVKKSVDDFIERITELQIPEKTRVTLCMTSEPGKCYFLKDGHASDLVAVQKSLAERIKSLKSNLMAEAIEPDIASFDGLWNSVENVLKDSINLARTNQRTDRGKSTVEVFSYGRFESIKYPLSTALAVETVRRHTPETSPIDATGVKLTINLIDLGPRLPAVEKDESRHIQNRWMSMFREPKDLTFNVLSLRNN